MEEKLLNVREVARYLNMSEEDVRDLVEKGDLPAYKIGGSLLRFKRNQIEGFRRRKDAAFVEDRAPSSRHQEVAETYEGIPSAAVSGSFRRNPMDTAGIKYTVWEKLEDFLYYNDFYILSLIILVLILLAVFGF